jgi:hypothetical protein
VSGGSPSEHTRLWYRPITSKSFTQILLEKALQDRIQGVPVVVNTSMPPAPSPGRASATTSASAASNASTAAAPATTAPAAANATATSAVTTTATAGGAGTTMALPTTLPALPQPPLLPPGLFRLERLYASYVSQRAAIRPCIGRRPIATLRPHRLRPQVLLLLPYPAFENEIFTTPVLNRLPHPTSLYVLFRSFSLSLSINTSGRFQSLSRRLCSRAVQSASASHHDLRFRAYAQQVVRRLGGIWLLSLTLLRTTRLNFAFFFQESKSTEAAAPSPGSIEVKRGACAVLHLFFFFFNAPWQYLTCPEEVQRTCRSFLS